MRKLYLEFMKARDRQHLIHLPQVLFLNY